MSTKPTSIFESNLIWRLLTYFFRHASSETYAKKLARDCRMGPTSVNRALQKLKNMGLLKMEEKGRVRLYSLNGESEIVRSLKVAWFLALLEERGLVREFVELDEGLISLVLYGSFANGSFDERSDLDLLAISQKQRRVFVPLIGRLETSMKMAVSLEVSSILQWKAIREKDEGFHKEVMSNHILLYGSELP
jgi:hypothetical protein